MESVEYSTSSSETPEHAGQADSQQDWSQQNGVHLNESGLPSMAYDMPSVLGHDQVSEPSTPPVSAPAASVDRRTGPTARAREATQLLSATLTELNISLDEYEAERAQSAQEREMLEERIRELQQHEITKDRFVDTVRRGSAGSVTDEELETVRGMMDALSQDPDRLTVLFTVVQQASKLAAVVNDYTALRRMVDSH